MIYSVFIFIQCHHLMDRLINAKNKGIFCTSSMHTEYALLEKSGCVYYADNFYVTRTVLIPQNTHENRNILWA